MKRSAILAALLIVAVMSLLVTACGGGSPAPTSSGTASTAPPPPPSASAAPAAPGVSETETARPFTPTATTPKFFTDLLALKSPVVVIFYTKSAPVWADVSKEVAAVQKRYGNQAEFLEIPIDNTTSMASLAASEQAKAREVTNLAEQLGVKFTPYVVIIDRATMITYTHSGYIDDKTLEQALFKALKR